MKISNKDKQFLIEVFIALAQVTFGVAWGSIFLPVDQYKPFVVIFNIVITFGLLSLAWLLNKK